MRATVATEAKAIVGLVRGLGPRVHVAFEEGTQAQWLHDLLLACTPSAWWCAMCAGESEIANKSDRIDADRLSELLRLGALKSVYHGSPSVLRRSRSWFAATDNLVEDSTRVMQRIKAMFRARAIETPGEAVYRPSPRKSGWPGSRSAERDAGAHRCSPQLDVLLELRPKAKAAMIAEARRQPGWKILRSVPFLGPVRVAQLLAIMATPFRFRTKRQLWPYAGLAVVTRSSAGSGVRRREAAPAEASAAHARTESESQSDAQDRSSKERRMQRQRRPDHSRSL